MIKKCISQNNKTTKYGKRVFLWYVNTIILIFNLPNPHFSPKVRQLYNNNSTIRRNVKKDYWSISTSSHASCPKRSSYSVNQNILFLMAFGKKHDSQLNQDHAFHQILP